jgi:hypothetical protein
MGAHQSVQLGAEPLHVGGVGRLLGEVDVLVAVEARRAAVVAAVIVELAPSEHLPGAFSSSIFRDKNRRGIGKSQSQCTACTMETLSISRAVHCD